MKKLLLTLLLILALISTTVFAEVTFTDVNRGYWYYDSVTSLAEMGLVSGYPDGTFGPNNPITVAELTTIVARTFEENPPAVSGTWYQKYVNYSMSKNLIKTGEFTAEDYTRNVTRGEIARIIVRAMQEKGENIYDPNIYDYVSEIGDYNPTPQEYREFILYAYSNGIMSGYPNGHFNADETATRAEACIMVLRLIDPLTRSVVAKPNAGDGISREGTFLDEDGKAFVGEDNTVIYVSEYTVVSYYNEIMKLVENDSNYRVEVENDLVSVTIELYQPEEKEEIDLEMTFDFNPTGFKVDNPYSVTLNAFKDSSYNKQTLKNILMIYYPNDYMTIYDYMMDVYADRNDDITEFGVTQLGRKDSLIKETTSGAVYLRVGKWITD